MTSRSHKSRRITARSAPTAINHPTVGRTPIVALMTAGAFAAYLLMASSARGAEFGSANSSLKWKTRSTVSAPTRTTSMRLELGEEPSSELPPIRTAAAAGMRFDSQVVQTQALSDDPLKNPFKDNAAPGTLPNIAPSAPTPGALPVVPPSDQLAVGGGFQQEPCPTVDEFKKIGAITNRIAASSGDLPNECIIDDRTELPMNRDWCQTVYTWKASGMCHKPLYFEEEALERYGHSTGPFSQPVVSAAHFFGSLAVLPYNMGMDPPGECKYALGYYRPGSCAPYVIPGLPLSARGAAAQAAFVGGAIYLLP